jgi:peptide/nickel transport system substrate-binding protein
MARRYAAPYNPRDARRLLAAAHATGPYTLLVPQLPQFSASAELIQAELAQVGMTVTIVAKPVPDYLSLAGQGQFDMNLWGWSYNDPDILFLLFHSSQGKGAGGNFTNYSGAGLDDLLVKGRETVDSRKARSIYRQIQVFMARQSFIVPLALSTQPTGVRSRVKGWHFVRPANVMLYQDASVVGR